MSQIEVEELAAEPAQIDSSLPNRSSIAVLMEYESNRILVPGDLPDDELIQAIEELLRQSGEQRLRLDAMIVPHHGSRTAMSERLLELIDCPRFLVSTDGSRFRHPSREAIARIVTRSSGATELMFNYRSDQTEIWSDPALQAQFGYTATYPSDPNVGLLVDLLSPPEPVAPVSLTIEHEADGIRTRWSRPGLRQAELEPKQIEPLADAILTSIEDWAQERQTVLDDDRFGRRLVDLAEAGSRLSQHLFGDAGRPRALGDGPVSLRTTTDAYLPLECLYEAPIVADDAELCPTWREALETGTCEACDDADRPGRHVCPIAFWGLRRPIERVFTYDDAEPVPATTDTPFKRVDRLLLGLAREMMPEDVEATLAAIDKLGAESTIVDSWDELRGQLAKQRWPLVAVLAHRDQESEVAAYVIGDDRIPEPQLASDLSAQSGVVVVFSAFGPTMPTSVSRQLLHAGFRACVSNVGSITGSDAARALQHLVGRLAHPAADETLGTALLRTRRRLVLEQNVLGFSMLASGRLDLGFDSSSE